MSRIRPASELSRPSEVPIYGTPCSAAQAAERLIADRRRRPLNHRARQQADRDISVEEGAGSEDPLECPDAEGMTGNQHELVPGRPRPG